MEEDGNPIEPEFLLATYTFTRKWVFEIGSGSSCYGPNDPIEDVINI